MKDVNRRRLTREETREQTRQRLIRSARQQVAARGFNAASMRDIAEAAGYSQGAFYSNFESKEALLLEVLKLHKLEESERVATIIDAAGEDLKAALDGLDAWAEKLSESPEHALVSAELQLHAVRNADFGKAYWAIMAEQRALYARLAKRLFDLSKTPPPVTLEDLASGLMALERSVALDRVISPGGISSMVPILLRALLHSQKRS